MVLKLYGSKIATCTKRVATVLLEKNVPFQLIEIDFMKGEQKNVEHIENQPFGQIPYIDDEGFILYESRAICRYIAAKYSNQGTQLIPTDLKGTALYEQAASVELSHFHPVASAAVAEIVYKPFMGQVSDPVMVDLLSKNVEAKLEVYDKILSKQKYIAGDEFSLIDIFHLSYGSLLVVDGVKLTEKKPNVARWFQDITSRPSWVSASAGVKSTASVSV